MTSRERIQAAIRHEAPDQLPKNESFWETTLAEWRKQGMPEDVNAEDFFGFDICYLAMDASPRFEMRVLDYRDGWITYEDRFGYTVRNTDDRHSTMHFLQHVTSSRDVWESDVKPRFQLSEDPAEPARVDTASYFRHLEPYPTWEDARQQFDALHQSGRYVLMHCYGPHEATWRHRGFTPLLTDMLIDPEWVRDMAETYIDLVVAVYKKCFEIGIKPDGHLMVEDMGFIHAPYFSKETWRDVYRTCYMKLRDLFRENHVDFWLHSDGHLLPLLDDLIDGGVQVLNPVEAKAGMDWVELHERFGPKLAYYGNIDVLKMLGPREALEAELQRKIPPARSGGYIMHSDHSVPPEVSYEQYCWMQKRARELFEQAF